ncbi:MAG TPA: hypothetical protein VHL10_04620 [Nitrososphaera sp.]|nr:hypothetical protein [Nitrososphaera sp.]
MKQDIIKCQNCQLGLVNNGPFFYTLAKNSYMFGFFCCRDCATSSEYNRYLHAYVVKINATAESHRDLVVVPSLQVLKQFKEESERRELRKKYF